MKVGLYFGTFNPIHVGHLIIANYMAEFTDLDQVWLVVSPHNPLAIVNIAIEDNPKLKSSDIEFKLNQPSYTATTLAYLIDKHPTYDFSLIMGEDNLRSIHKWFNFENILHNHRFFVYPRALTSQEEIEKFSEENNFRNHPNVTILNNAPAMKISASYIRDAIKIGKEVKYLLTEPVYKYVMEMNFFK
jgi:nicotinate-nucleotide adenylyltransferase